MIMLQLNSWLLLFLVALDFFHDEIILCRSQSSLTSYQEYFRSL